MIAKTLNVFSSVDDPFDSIENKSEQNKNISWFHAYLGFIGTN